MMNMTCLQPAQIGLRFGPQGFPQSRLLPGDSCPGKTRGTRRRGWLYATAILLLGGYLLFAHGCHGDEDMELFLGLSGLGEARAKGDAHPVARVGFGICTSNSQGRGISNGSGSGNMGNGWSFGANWTSWF